MQSNFFMDPLEQFFAVGLIKSMFVHYGIVENSNKSNHEEINYENP
jgi:hypothetical protein